MKCAHCNASNAPNKWTVSACADTKRNRSKYLCDKHDIKLNRYVLNFFGDTKAECKIREYARKMKGNKT